VFDRLPRLILVPHADAGDRTTWMTDQDLRPLSAAGIEQAAALFRSPAPPPLVRGGGDLVDATNANKPIVALGAVVPLPKKRTGRR
jgi:hypothetical protein